jgi:hypothetical protein
MSRLSKTFLIAAPVLFFLAFVIYQWRLWDLHSQLGGASEEWASALVHLYTTGWDI